MRPRFPKLIGYPFLAFMVLAMGLLMIPSASYSTIVVRDLWAPDGEVRAVAQANNTLYLGGSFSHVGPVSGPAVALDLATAVAQTPYPKVAGKINTVEPDGSGGWYIGGLFTAVQGQRRANLAHIDAAGQVTPWNPRIDGEVLDVAISPGVVYVVGRFESVGTMWGSDMVWRFCAAAINATTGIPTHWNPDPSSLPTNVEVGGGKVYLAGYFTTIYFDTSNEPRPHLAEFTEVIPGNTSSGALTGRFAGSFPSLTMIEGLELADGKLFYASTYTFGNFLQIYDVTAGSSFPYSVPLDGPVYDIALDQAHGTFFLGGSFASVQGQPRANLAALNLADGTVVPSWNVPADATVRTLALAPNGLLVGGEFSTLGGSSRRGLGLVDPLSPTVLAWDAALAGNVQAVEVNGSRACVGGDFTIINGVPRSNLAALDETSGALLAWNPTTNATVDALMTSGSSVYVGGQFSNVNGTTRNRAASVDALTGALNAFNPSVDVSSPTTVTAFAIDGSTVYMGGVFGTVGGVGRGSLAAVDATTGAILPWNPNANGSVYALSFVPGGIFGDAIVVVGGQFTLIGGQVRNNLATVDAQTGAPGAALHNPNGSVLSMVVEPLPPGYGGVNDIYIGGTFTSVGGQPRNGIAQIAPLSVLGWAPNANGVVEAITKVGNTVFVGGIFTSIGAGSPQPRRNIAALDANNGAATTWDPNALGGAVHTILERAGTVYAGGSFTSIAGTPHSHFAGMGGIVTAVESEPVSDATPLALRAAPNPFDRSTKIQFSMRAAGETRITVYDVTGRRVREIHSGWLPSGRHTMSWDGREDSGLPVAAGVYFLGVKTRTGSFGSKIYRVK
jgi:hypothetical protein